MKILIIAATPFEIQPFIDVQLQYPDCDYLITGVGMTQTAYQLGKHLATHSYDLLINIGIAGCFDRQIAIGEVLQIYEDVFVELGAENDQEFITLDQLGFGKTTFKPRQEKQIQNFFTGITAVQGITVNTAHGNLQSIEKIRLHYPDAIVESMEGAAVFLVAEQEKTKSIQLRGISNYVEKRNQANWNIALAIKNSNTLLMQVLNQIYGQ